MPERRLQYYLNEIGRPAKVFTVGASGYGQDQQLLTLQEYYQTYRADLVILWQTPDNDIWNNIFPTHWPANGTPKPTFWLEHERLHGPTEQMEEALPAPSLKLLALWQQAFASPERDAQWEQYLPPAYLPMEHYDGPVHHEWQELWDDNPTRMRDENLQNEKSHLAISLTPRSKRMEYGIELTRRLLQNIKALVTSHNGTFLIVRTTKAGQEPASNKENVQLLNGKYYRSSKKQAEATIHDINRGFHAIAIPIVGEHPHVGPADIHLNEHAVDHVMKELAHVLDVLSVL
jgi:hypothetical protein